MRCAPLIPVKSGLEVFLESPPKEIRGERLALLCNPASVDPRFIHARERIHQALPGHLSALFSPQHGFFSEKQDNMIESAHMEDPLLRIPVFSLYGETRHPTREMFETFDVLLVDLQDVGTRVYTFIYTLSYCMEAAKAFGKKVVILDRPNPVGGTAVEGDLLDPAFTSFVGRYPIPMRHGLTIGELALLFNGKFGIGCDLTIIPMDGWMREMVFTDTGLPWVAPSPNLPTPDSALVYPGQVIFEGTNISEGRGTTLPFEQFGAPFLRPEEMLSFLGKDPLPGAVLRPVGFEPTSNKWAGTLCKGFQIHVTQPDRYNALGAALRLLRAMMALYPGDFAFKTPPYEYDWEHLPLDLILGNSETRQRLGALEPVEALEASWQKDLLSFETLRQEVMLYS